MTSPTPYLLPSGYGPGGPPRGGTFLFPESSARVPLAHNVIGNPTDHMPNGGHFNVVSPPIVVSSGPPIHPAGAGTNDTGPASPPSGLHAAANRALAFVGRLLGRDR
jgi:hypothetical protein